MCARNINGLPNKDIEISNLTLSWFQNNLTKNILLQLEKIFFCGNLGDPCATPELLKIIEYIKFENPAITIGINTNGSIRNINWWKQCAQLLTGRYDYVIWSIDGLEDTNHLYRHNVNWNKLIANAKSYIEAGGIAHWDMLVFEHNKHQVEHCLSLATDLGFSWFRIKETDRWDHYKDLGISSASEYAPIDYASVETVNCERNQENSEYIDSYGEIWPCCHIAEAKYNFVYKKTYTDIQKYTPKELCNLYQKKLDTNKPFDICKRSCAANLNKKSQWKKEICIK
jgi:hypothetical protein